MSKMLIEDYFNLIFSISIHTYIVKKINSNDLSIATCFHRRLLNDTIKISYIHTCICIKLYTL